VAGTLAGKPGERIHNIGVLEDPGRLWPHGPPVAY
jgi:hypothetical protein